ncbi:MAG: membrane protein insertase YidC [Bacteroidota bacterium]
MNRKNSQLIGVMLLALLSITYFEYFGKKKPSPSPQSKSIQATTKKEDFFTKISNLTLPDTAPVNEHTSSLTLENEEVCICLDPKGGMVNKVILKGHYSHDKQPLKLVEANYSNMAWLLSTPQGPINTKDLHFTAHKKENQIELTHILDAKKAQYIRYIYTLPKKGFELDCKVEVSGLDVSKQNGLSFLWHYQAKNLEKDFNLNTRYAYLQYHLKNNKTQYATNAKATQINQIEWLAMHQRFFTAGIILTPGNYFTNGEVANRVSQSAQNHTIMQTATKLALPLKEVGQKAEAKLKFYFGPNDKKILAQVSPSFKKVHYLGWPVIKSINQYIISPLADSFHKHVNHYVWVLLLLALIFKLLQFYFAYKDYVITLKKKALQPAVKKLKAQYKDKQQASMAEAGFYREMGLPALPDMFKLFTGLLEAPIFMAMLHFIPNQIALRQVSFLWVKDLSGVDDFIQLPFRIPLLGTHISLLAIIMCASFMLRNNSQQAQQPTELNAKVLKYLFPVFIFVAFNGYPAGFFIYRIFVNASNLAISLLFKQVIDEKFHLAQIKQREPHIDPNKKDLPRALARLDKNKKKT